MATATSTTIARPSRNELIETSLDKGVAGKLAINRESGGMVFHDMSEAMEFAKLMSLSKQAVPPHCREQPGVCLGLLIQAIEWRMSPFAVAGKSYVVNDRIGYESQLIHAVIEQRAPILSRLRHEFTGEGANRKCRVWATARGESESLEYTSPEFATITPKNSPLWKSKSDLQLYYNTSRDWARIYFPDVILGVYAEDELADLIIDRGGAPVAGIAGLKNRLNDLAMQPPEQQPADERDESAIASQDAQDVDQTAPAEEAEIDRQYREMYELERGKQST